MSHDGDSTNVPALPMRRRILLIDDNEQIHDDFRKTLLRRRTGTDLSWEEAALFGTTRDVPASKIEFELESATQGEAGLSRVKAALEAQNPYHLAFIDMRMPPGWDGLRTIEEIWKIDPELQVVLCTAYSDYSWDQILQRLGPTDRLLILKKPFDDIEVSQLATTLTEKWIQTRAARLKLDELEALVDMRTQELRSAALHDRLTGLPNRAFLMEQLARAINAHRRDPKRNRFALLFLDFDRFKVINDSLGHEVGDRLLIAVAERLRGSLRDTDTISPAVGNSVAARLGGDEFIVLLEQIDDHDAARVAQRLLQVLSTPYDLGGRVVQSTVSIGVTTGSVGYARPEDAIRDADTAMYRAKAAGKDRCVLFDQRMHEDAVRRLTIETDLRQAIAHDEFVLHYQPIVSLETGQTVGAEGLIRWQHPVRGLLAPGEFIPIAEDVGLIVPVGDWVLRHAIADLARWKSDPRLSQLSVSINVSARQLRDDTFFGRVRDELQRADVPPQRLKLEITESIVMDDASHGLEILSAIAALGVDLHMDDFGTGYSSLGCLHRFPFRGVKIDRAFVQNVGERRDYAAVVHAIISLAHNLDIRLVAEGVETAEHVSLLQSLGCDFAQGFYFARPMIVEELERRLVESRCLAA